MTTAAIYCRISKDAEDEGLGVARQEEDCRALVAREGWTLVEPPFVDNDISASTRSKKVRPAYQAMLAAVRASGVDVIVAYSNSRLTRRMLELEELITLHEQTGVRIHTVVSGNDDLATADGRMVARIKASVDAGEADRTAERLRRKFLEKAQKGTVGQGTRPFGWADDKKALHPKEARMLRKAIQDVIDGVPTREIARRWNAAGVTTVPRKVRGTDGEFMKDKDGEFVLQGNPWNHTAVRQVLRNPRLAGWRTHQKEIARGADGAPVRGVWTPMVDQATFDALQGALDGRAPKTRRGAQRYLLSSIARCGICSARMSGTRTKTGYAYQCCLEGADHTVTVAGKQTDALIAETVARRLASIDLESGPVAAVEWEGEARLRAIPEQIRELMTAFRSGVLSGAVALPQVGLLEAEQATLERERPAGPPLPVRANAETFPGLDLDRQRAVVEALVEAVIVVPAIRRGAPWTPERLTLVWRRA
jgi:DNA invertase Pin-like site-specific DNA recombinase